MIWFGCVLWHINLCRLFNAKSSLYIYVSFSLVVFYGISTFVGYSMSNPLYTYKYMICLDCVLWHTNLCRLFYAKSSLYIYVLFGLVVFYGISNFVGY